MPPKPKQVTTITINTDASFHKDYKVGGWAFIIVCDLFRIHRSGSFKLPVKNPQDAEIMAIGNALAHLLKIKNLPEFKWLIVNSDCKHGMKAIRTNKDALSKKVHKLWQRCILKTKSKKNKFRHVKAHTGRDNLRSKANQWCDTNAKNHAQRVLNKAVIAANKKNYEKSQV